MVFLVFHVVQTGVAKQHLVCSCSVLQDSKCFTCRNLKTRHKWATPLSMWIHFLPSWSLQQEFHTPDMMAQSSKKARQKLAITLIWSNIVSMCSLTQGVTHLKGKMPHFPTLEEIGEKISHPSMGELTAKFNPPQCSSPFGENVIFPQIALLHSQ